MIRPVRAQDFEQIAAIYNHYVRNTVVTFEEESVTAEEIAARVQETAATSLPWLVAEEFDRIVGYAYASKWKSRRAYRFSVESTVYLDPSALGRGLGTMLYEALFATLRQQGVHAVIGGIALPNPGSVALHEKFGLRKVAHFPEVGFKFNEWIDVGYWQLCFTDAAEASAEPPAQEPTHP